MFFFRMPRYMSDGELLLRPLRMANCRLVIEALNDLPAPKASGLNKLVTRSGFFAWWLMKKSFIVAYCIEYNSKPVGFIGLYDIIPGKSAEVSLLIYDDSRRMGYGTRAFRILDRELNRSRLVEKLTIKVKADNFASISFWKSLGFEYTLE